MFYRRRDKLLNDGTKLFARGGVDHEAERLQRENRKLKETIGELTMELKKTTVSNAGMEGFSATKSAGSSVRYMASGTWNTSNSQSANFPKSTRKKTI